MKIKEIIVVEGKDDTRRVKEAVEADTIETNGSAINESVLRMIERAQATRGVIVLTDPDFPGGKIRTTIEQRIPGVKHAFLRKRDSQSPHGGSLGVEHAHPDVIREALENVHTPALPDASGREGVSRSELSQLGFLGKPHSAAYREVIGDVLGIGHTNGKQLSKRLEMFQISRNDLLKAMREGGLPLPQGKGKD